MIPALNHWIILIIGNTGSKFSTLERVSRSQLLFSSFLHDSKVRHEEKQQNYTAIVFKELESVMLSKISQAVKDKYHMISPLIGT